MKNLSILLVAATALLASVAQVQAQSYQIVYRCTDSAGLDVDASLCVGLPKPGCTADVTGSTAVPELGELIVPGATGPSSSIVGDPAFVGLKGQEYQIHGVPNRVFNLVSDKESSVNALFIYKDSGKCPVVNGQVQKEGCYSHPGTYLAQIGLQTSTGDHIYIEAGSYDQGFRNVSVNGDSVKIGASALDYSVQHSHSHIVTVRLAQFTFTFTNSDMFLNQEIALNDVSSIDSAQAHGLLGQTVSGKEYNSKFKYIQGTPSDYMLDDEPNALWSTQYKYNLFN